MHLGKHFLSPRRVFLEIPRILLAIPIMAFAGITIGAAWITERLVRVDDYLERRGRKRKEPVQDLEEPGPPMYADPRLMSDKELAELLNNLMDNSTADVRFN